MANPTTNYGFVLPTSSDLVTDLPADFDVALQGVDTRLKALQPGTTLGDLAYSSATANTNTRLAVGTNGQVLTVSGGVPAWTTLAGSTPTMYEVRFTASTTWTVPTGVTKVWVTMIGGGGGGANYGSYLGEAGKHGAVKDEMVTVTPGASVTVTIGAGGAGGTGGSGSNGSTGSQSEFGALTAAGGYFGAAAMWALSGLARGKQAEATPINGGVTNAVSSDAVGTAGTANTGGGGGSSRSNTGGSPDGGAGGSGFIFIRYVI